MESLGRCPRSLRHCYKCPSSLGAVVKNKNIPGALDQLWWKTLRCPTCATEWYVCVECDRAHLHMAEFDQLKQHFTRYHRPKKRKNKTIIDRKEKTNVSMVVPGITNDPMSSSATESLRTDNNQQNERDDPVLQFGYEPMEDDVGNLNLFDHFVEECDGTQNHKDTTINNANDECPYECPFESSIELLEESVMQSILKENIICHERDSTTQFLKSELKSDGGGAKLLVANSFYNGNVPSDEIPQEDIEICLSLAVLVFSLSTKQNKQLGKLWNTV